MKVVLQITAIALACFAATVSVAEERTSYFRKNSGIAVDDSKPLPSQLEDEQQVWRQPLPLSSATPCICGDRIFVTSYDPDKDNELATIAFDIKTGKVLWKKVAPSRGIEKFHRAGSPAACTPACDGERLFVFFGSYGLLCYDLDGKQLWAKPMGPFQDEFGASSSPIVVDGKVILNEDHDIDNYLLALDAKTGKTIWKTSRAGFTRSYASPMVWEANGQKQLIVAGALQLTAYSIEDGKRLWWIDGLARLVNPTPVASGDLLFVPSWTMGGDSSERISMEPWEEATKLYDKNNDGKINQKELPAGSPVIVRFFRIDLNQDGGLDQDEWEKHAKVFELAQNSVMAVKAGANGDATKTHIRWQYRRALPYVPSPLVYRGVFYMVANAGIFSSLKPETGEVLKQGRVRGRGNYYSSLVAGDGKIYAASERGVVTVLKAGAKWEVLSSRDFRERLTATPVLHDGKVFIRTDKAMYCFAK